MTSKSSTSHTSRMVKTAAFVIIVAGMMASSAIINPLLMALFIAIVCGPPLKWLKDKKVGLGTSVVIVFTGIIIILLVFTMIFGNSFANFVNNSPQYEAKLIKMADNAIEILNNLGLSVSTSDFNNIADPSKIFKFTTKIISDLGGFMSNSFLIFFILLFLLLEQYSFTVKTQAIVDENAEDTIQYYNNIADKIRNYLSIKTVVSAITGGLIWILLAIIGVDYPILWGVLAFLLNYIPNIGSIIAGVPPVLLAAIQLGPWGALWTALAFLAVNMVMGNAVEPKLLGKGLGLSTLVVFLSLIFWGFVLGTVGMFLAIPLTLTAKLIFDHNPDTRWVGVLLGSEKDAQAIIDQRKSKNKIGLWGKK